MSSPSFEVQIYRKGRWETGSAHGSASEAEDIAKSLQSKGKIEGVRVVREQFDGNSNRYVTSVLFRWVRGQEEQREAARNAAEKDIRAESVLANARAARLAAEREREARRAARRIKFPFWFWPMIGGVVAALAGISLLIGLRSVLYPN
jgi:hypothetical protein